MKDNDECCEHDEVYMFEGKGFHYGTPLPTITILSHEREAVDRKIIEILAIEFFLKYRKKVRKIKKKLLKKEGKC